MSDLILPMFNSLLIALEGSLLKLFFEESNNNMPASPTTPNLSATLGDTIVCDELVKAIEGVTTNGKTKLQQG